MISCHWTGVEFFTPVCPTGQSGNTFRTLCGHAHCLRGHPHSPVFAFLLHLGDVGLPFSFLRVYLALILAHHPPLEGCSVFAYATWKRFLKGLARIHPTPSQPSPCWDLLLVLQKLTGHLLKPLETCLTHNLAWKTAFLVAITLAQRVSELRALRHDSPYLTVHVKGVSLFPEFSFLPKVDSPFHLHATIDLPAFFPAPASEEEFRLHTLIVRRALVFYLDRTIAAPLSCLWCMQAPSGGRQVSKLAYLLARLPLSGLLRAHGRTRAAFLRGVPVEDICHAATWASPPTFMSHYVPATEDTCKERSVGS